MLLRLLLGTAPIKYGTSNRPQYVQVRHSISYDMEFLHIIRKLMCAKT